MTAPIEAADEGREAKALSEFRGISRLCVRDFPKAAFVPFWEEL